MLQGYLIFPPHNMSNYYFLTKCVWNEHKVKKNISDASVVTIIVYMPGRKGGGEFSTESRCKFIIKLWLFLINHSGWSYINLFQNFCRDVKNFTQINTGSVLANDF